MNNKSKTSIFKNIINVRKVKKLIRDGVDVNLIQYGELPIWLAIHNKHYDIAKILVKYGADINKETEIVCPIIHLSTSNFDILDFLIYNNINWLVIYNGKYFIDWLTTIEKSIFIDKHKEKYNKFLNDVELLNSVEKYNL